MCPNTMAAVHKMVYVRSVPRLLGLLILCMVIPADHCLRIPFKNDDGAGAVRILVTEIRHDRIRRSSDDLPQEMVVNLDNSEVNVTLRIHRNFDVDVNVPLTVQRDLEGQGSTIVQEHLDDFENVGLYINEEEGSAFLANFDVNTDMAMKYSLLGSFYVGTQEYLVQPTRADHGSYEIRKIQKSLATLVDPPDQQDPPITRARPTRRRRQTVDKYAVEVLFVADYSVYSFWYDQSLKDSAMARDKEAKQLMRQFFAFTLNGMNMRYKSVTGSGFTISVAFAGLHVADSVAASYWTESPIVHEGFLYDTVVDKALDLFHNWITNSLVRRTLPHHDHAMLTTVRDLGLGDDNSIVGLAHNISSVCTSQSQTIVETGFDGLFRQVPAHELGHSLGAYHDGTKNDCSEEDGYIMSPLAELSFSNLERNRRMWIFSHCSIEYFSTYIDKLNSMNNNCLTSFGPTYNASALVEFDDVIAGQVYSPDTQCHNIIGPSSYMCREFYPDGDFSGICAALFCSDREDEDNGCKESIPLEGTTCGNGKICRAGRCVRSPDAPQMPVGRCPFGESKRTFRWKSSLFYQRVNCSQIASRNSCDGYSQACCQSCPECTEDTSGCFSQLLKRSLNCSDLAMAGICCATCKGRSTPAPVVLSCPTTIPNGRLGSDCSGKLHTSCEVTCYLGFFSVNKYVTCEADGRWNGRCQPGEPVKCPSSIRFGELDRTCSLTVGSACIPNCSLGVSGEEKTFTCTADGTWSGSCLAIDCPSPTGLIRSGFLEYYCDNKPGSSCDVTCYGGGVKQISCDQNGAWKEDLATICHREENTSTGTHTGTHTVSFVGIVGAAISGVVFLFSWVACVVYRLSKRFSRRGLQGNDREAFANNFENPTDVPVVRPNQQQQRQRSTGPVRLTNSQLPPNLPVYVVRPRPSSYRIGHGGRLISVSRGAPRPTGPHRRRGNISTHQPPVIGRGRANAQFVNGVYSNQRQVGGHIAPEYSPRGFDRSHAMNHDSLPQRVPTPDTDVAVETNNEPDSANGLGTTTLEPCHEVSAAADGDAFVSTECCDDATKIPEEGIPKSEQCPYR